MARRPKSLMQGIVERVGVRKGYRLMSFLVAWEIARNEHDGPMSVEQYADYWKVSYATAYREQALFREAFGEWYSTPEELMQAARDASVSVSALRWSW